MLCTAAAIYTPAARRTTTCSAQAPKPVPCIFRRAAAGAAGALLLVAGAPALAADLALGEEVFNNNCAACHTGGANVVQVEKTLSKASLETYLDGGFNEGAIVKQVTNGKASAGLCECLPCGRGGVVRVPPVGATTTSSDRLSQHAPPPPLQNAMPAWGDRLTEEEIQAVAAYVFNQANSGW
eukprot:scaffold4.g5034.t1